MARSSPSHLDDDDCLRLLATPSPRTRGAEKKESTGLRLNQPCPPYVTPSSISSFDRRLSSAHIAESKSLKNSGANTFCQSSASSSTVLNARLYAQNAVRAAFWSRGKVEPNCLISCQLRALCSRICGPSAFHARRFHEAAPRPSRSLPSEEAGKSIVRTTYGAILDDYRSRKGRSFA